ncbi:MAG: hypothetical protein LC104_18465 [Bacteroidales bacterium]|nr:hypothetical protein [Bacteroidales bacterium]
MAKRMSTAARMDRMRDKAAISRTVNGLLKRKERKNRDARMKELLQKGTFPYTPAIMSWVSVQLNKPTTLITAEEARALAN